MNYLKSKGRISRLQLKQLPNYDSSYFIKFPEEQMISKAKEKSSCIWSFFFEVVICFYALQPHQASAQSRICPLKIACSNPALGLLEDASRAYEAIDDSSPLTVELQRAPNRRIANLMASGYADIAIHSGMLNIADINTLQQSDLVKGKFEQRSIGKFAVAIVVHPENMVKSLSVRQIGGICAGELTNWEQLGRPQRKIVIVGQNLQYNSTEILNRIAFPNQPLTSNLIEKTNKGEVIEFVKKNRGAIGYFLHDWKRIEGVRTLSISRNDERKVSEIPIQLSESDVLHGQYPLTDDLVAIIHPNSPREVRVFLELFRTEVMAKSSKDRRILTEYHKEDLFREQRILNAQKGEGSSVKATGSLESKQLFEELTYKYVMDCQAIQHQYRSRSSINDAIKDIHTGRAEILILDGNSIDLLSLEDLEMKKVSFAKSALGIIAHSERKLTSLSFEELQQIASGEIKNWPEAEGMGPPIRGYALNATHPVMPIYFKQLVKRKQADREGTGLLLNSRIDNQQVINSIVQDPTGIGFVDLSQLPPLDGSVVLVGIATANGKVAQPAVGMVPEGYPLVKPLTLFVSPTASEAAKRFADWLEQNPCEDVLARHYLMPPNGIQTSKTKELIASNKLEESAEASVELASATTESTPETAASPDVEAPAESTPMSEAEAEAKSESGVSTEKPAATTEQSTESADDSSSEPIVVASVEPKNRSEADSVPEALSDLLEPATESSLPDGVIDTEATEVDWTRTTLLVLALCAVSVLLALGIRMQWLKLRRKQWAENNPLTLAE